MKNMTRGFTLAELLLCIGIIGVVSAMGMVIAKRGTDSAYNLYYYSGYINLYNAIADAKTKPDINTNQNIMEHVQDVLSSSNVVAKTNKNIIDIALATPDIDFINMKCNAYDINKFNPYNKNQKDEFGDKLYVVDPENNNTTTDKKPDIKADNYDDPKNPQTPDQKDPQTPDQKDDETGETNGTGESIVWPNPDGNENVTTITTSNGINYIYNSSLNNGTNGLVVPEGSNITKAIPIIMTIPQRATRDNNGRAIVRLLYIDADNGYLIPMPEANGTISIQDRRDLLPAYIDDGRISRYSTTDASGRQNRGQAIVGSYKDAYCSIRGNTGNIDGVINCASFTNISLNGNRVGALAIANPRKVH